MESEFYEELRISAGEITEEIKKEIKRIIEEGKARRVVVKNQANEEVFQMSLPVGVVAVLFAPFLTLLGAAVALASDCTIVFERKE
ncbi:DUF4342 domain-containing protein [Candidatus Jorgensenbacteria bacterium]|nr:DUF4342 domain-containing protein [Candidatus Jorgensenbacteria bacterium]